MAKSKNRSQYLTSEPNWAVHSLATTEDERYAAWRSTNYFIHQEISDRESNKAFRDWVKTSGWTKDIQTRVLAAPDYAYISIGQHAGKKYPSIESLLNSIGLNAKEVEEAHKELSDNKQEFDELARVRKLKGPRSDWDEQLVEGYAFINTPNLRKTLKWFTEGLVSLETFKTSKKVVRRKKPQDPRKIVSRLRYMKADQDLKIASINPVDILGSTEVWTYDIKRKRLGVYMSLDKGGLMVHGTSIQGYDDKLSYEKTLRKHEEQLKGFMKLSKKAIQDYVGKIRGKQMPVKTRINPNMLLLKVQ